MIYQTMKSRLYLTQNETKHLRLLTRAAKNLYNEALYQVRQHYFKTNEYLSYYDNYHQLKNSENYRLLNATHAQNTIRKVDEAMKAFFGSIKKQVKGVRLPRCLDKEGYFPLVDRMVYKPSKDAYVLPRSNIIKRISSVLEQGNHERIKQGIDQTMLNDLSIVDQIYLTIKTPSYLQNKPMKEITIKPSFDGTYFTICYVYQTNVEKVLPNNQEKPMGIDFGYNNLAFCATKNDHLLLDGKYLKSLNQSYHKKMAYLSSKRPNQNRLTNQMQRLIIKRNNQMTYYINKAAKLVINFCLEHQVSNIIIGYNEGFKDIDLSKRFNQMSRSISIARLRDRIIYLASINGISTEVVNEAYTSLSSFLDKDDMKAQTAFSGTRVKRGLYKIKSNRYLNADLNAALNIIRKRNPEFEVGARGLNTPKKTYLNQLI